MWVTDDAGVRAVDQEMAIHIEASRTGAPSSRQGKGALPDRAMRRVLVTLRAFVGDELSTHCVAVCAGISAIVRSLQGSLPGNWRTRNLFKS